MIYAPDSILAMYNPLPQRGSQNTVYIRQWLLRIDIHSATARNNEHVNYFSLQIAEPSQRGQISGKRT